jgi:mediator of RNA polymerase II transcription subunit 12
MHSKILSSAMAENIMDRPTNQHLEQNVHDIHEALLDNFCDIKRRNEAMLFRNLPPRVLAQLGSAVSDVRVCLLAKYLGALLSLDITSFSTQSQATQT